MVNILRKKLIISTHLKLKLRFFFSDSIVDENAGELRPMILSPQLLTG